MFGPDGQRIVTRLTIRPPHRVWRSVKRGRVNAPWSSAPELAVYRLDPATVKFTFLVHTLDHQLINRPSLKS